MNIYIIIITLSIYSSMYLFFIISVTIILITYFPPPLLSAELQPRHDFSTLSVYEWNVHMVSMSQHHHYL